MNLEPTYRTPEDARVRTVTVTQSLLVQALTTDNEVKVHVDQGLPVDASVVAVELGEGVIYAVVASKHFELVPAGLSAVDLYRGDHHLEIVFTRLD